MIPLGLTIFTNYALITSFTGLPKYLAGTCLSTQKPCSPSPGSRPPLAMSREPNTCMCLPVLLSISSWVILVDREVGR